MFSSGGCGFQSSEVAGLWRVDRHGERVAARDESTRNVELVDAEGADDKFSCGQLLAVEPDIGRVVDAGKLQSSNLSGVFGRDLELGPIPPRTPELSGVDVFEVGAEVEIGVETVGHQSRHRGRWHRARVPAARVIPRARHRRRVARDLRSGLQGPPFGQLAGGAHRVTRLSTRVSEENDNHSEESAH
jgi:hypothetical protein